MEVDVRQKSCSRRWLGNRRIVVSTRRRGPQRHWRRYGSRPDDDKKTTTRRRRSNSSQPVHCGASRATASSTSATARTTHQVFRKSESSFREFFWQGTTTSAGWDMVSNDPGPTTVRRRRRNNQVKCCARDGPRCPLGSKAAWRAVPWVQQIAIDRRGKLHGRGSTRQALAEVCAMPDYLHEAFRDERCVMPARKSEMVATFRFS